MLAPSAKALGLKYNNQAVLEDDGDIAPVRIPNVSEGIKLIPEVPFEVAIGKHARLAIDFNLMDDMLDVYPEGQVECIMKPRLGYFDMASSGAIKGKIAFGNLSSPYFVIKAEQVVAGKPCRVVRRTATIDKNSGEFNLYPLPVFGNNTTAVYDILLRGEKVQTAIVKNVKVRKGATLSVGAVNLGAITMNPGNEFKAQLLNPMHPTGAWINFYQTLTTDPVSFEVRNQHLDPYRGKFPCPVRLSSEAIQVFDFSSGILLGPVIDATTSPGEFTAVAEAVLFGRSNGVAVSGAADTTTSFVPDVPMALPSSNRIDTTITIPASLQASLNKGYLFITSGGLIIDCYSADSLVTAGGGLLSIPNLPGGSTSAPFPGAFYGVNFIGWGNGSVVSGSQYNVDITTGNASASINLR